MRNEIVQLATQGATFSAGERLAQELQMIEAGIREKEKDVRNWSPYGTVPWIQSPNNMLSTQNFNQDYKSEEVKCIVIVSLNLLIVIKIIVEVTTVSLSIDRSGGHVRGWHRERHAGIGTAMGIRAARTRETLVERRGQF